MKNYDVDQLYDLRVNKGLLPTLDIAGHTFYVDLRMGMLRPKDDFLSQGIVFSDIGNYFDHTTDRYTIPYNPRTHEFEEPDDQITEFPKDLLAISFPHEYKMDPIGFNRKLGLDLKYGLNPRELNLHFKAETIPWEKTFLTDLIEANKNKANKQAFMEHPTDKKQPKQKITRRKL